MKLPVQTGIGRRDHGRTRRGIKCQHFGLGVTRLEVCQLRVGVARLAEREWRRCIDSDSGSVGKFACSLGYRLIRHVLIVVEWRPIV